MNQHFEQSSYRERLLEHLLISELLKLSWYSGSCSLEISRPEVDRTGYDVIAEAPGVVRHIQLKTKLIGSKSTSQTVHVSLGSKPAGCIVVVCFEGQSLHLGPFLFFGGGPREHLPSVEEFKLAKQVKANAQGVKSERKHHRVIPHSRFQKLQSVEALYERLFGA